MTDRKIELCPFFLLYRDVYGTMMFLVKKANDLLQDEAKQLEEYLQKTVNAFVTVLNDDRDTSTPVLLNAIQHIVGRYTTVPYINIQDG